MSEVAQVTMRTITPHKIMEGMMSFKQFRWVWAIVHSDLVGQAEITQGGDIYYDYDAALARILEDDYIRGFTHEVLHEILEEITGLHFPLISGPTGSDGKPRGMHGPLWQGQYVLSDNPDPDATPYAMSIKPTEGIIFAYKHLFPTELYEKHVNAFKRGASPKGENNHE